MTRTRRRMDTGSTGCDVKMAIDARLVEEQSCVGDGYRPVFDCGGWRVATLGYCKDCSPENVKSMQRHEETDEMFVLLAGRCILFVGEGSQNVTAIRARDMEPLRVYNVKRAVWHTHVLSKDAVILIIESRDTTPLNSPECPLSDAQITELRRAVAQIWGYPAVSEDRNGEADARPGR